MPWNWATRTIWRAAAAVRVCCHARLYELLEVNEPKSLPKKPADGLLDELFFISASARNPGKKAIQCTRVLREVQAYPHASRRRLCLWG